ncbi:SAM-dependent methyltransferase [Cryptosporangium sp. NPDC048952]|uniref:SAM-dependent methyltransferase n=1 Tax=Cryptosporangium sp. NPDC048952 TaxID=3363961 RepID=UPI00371D3B06
MSDAVELRTDRPHPARIYNYLLGGEDNFAADRAAAEAGLAVNPGAKVTARSNREFLRRVVTFLTGVGIDQFLDVGSGIPAADSTHLVAPDASVVYVDYDPLVVSLGADEPGRVHYAQADLREPNRVLARAGELLDLTRPVGLLLVAVTHHLQDAEDPHARVRRLVEALPAGSYLALSQLTSDFLPDEWRAIERDSGRRGVVLRARPGPEIARFFEGLDLVEPGLTPVHRWRPDDRDRQSDQPDEVVSILGAVARTP